MTMWSDMFAAGVSSIGEVHGVTITVRQAGESTGETVTAYHGLGDALGAADEKQERNFAGILVSALTFDPGEGDEVTDENGLVGQVVKARRTNHGTWELQVWRSVSNT